MQVFRKEVNFKSQGESNEVRLECEEQVTEDSDTSDNEIFHRNDNSWASADASKTAIRSPPFSPVKIVGRSGCLEPHQHEQLQKPTTMSKKMKFTFNEEPAIHARDSLPERPSASIGWGTEKV